MPTASAITKPGDISNADWNATWDAEDAWPPTATTSWPLPATNPALAARCGIDIGVIVDRSGSIADAGQATSYRNAVKDLVDGFAGTPSKLGVWSFANHASDTDATAYPWHQMAALDGASGPANVASLKATVDSIPIVTNFSTNWEEGLRAPLNAPVAASPKPDLVLVLTDGQPTVHADDSDSGGTTNNDDMAGGIKSANLLKADGRRVLAVGVGPNVSVEGLELISGPTAFNGTNISTADYLTTSFADLSAALEDFATTLCGGSVTVTKQTSTPAAPTSYANAAGWTFTGDITDPPPSATATPDQPSTPATNDGVTGVDGQVAFTWSSASGESITITETPQAGFQLASRTCTLNGKDFPVEEVANGLALDVAQGQHVVCTFRNQPVFIDLSVTKTDGKVTTSPGEVNDYTIGYGNAADATATATEVVLTETVPANTTYVAAGSSAWSCANGAPAGTSCTLNVGSLAPGAGGTAHFKVQVVNPVGAGVTQIANTVTVTGTGTERDLGDQTATDTDTLTAAPLLSVTKGDGDVTVVPGGLITYSIDYRNDGNKAATNVVLSDTVPANTTFVAAGSPGWDCNGGSPGEGDGATAGAVCTNAVGTVAGGGAGGSRPFQVRVVDPVPAGVTNVHNVVLIDDDLCKESCDTDDEDTPVDAAPELHVTKGDGDVTAVPGGLITYSIDYRNDGNKAATNVVLSDTVPANTTFVAAGSPGWDCNGGSPGEGDGATAGAVCTNAVGTVAGGGAGGSRPFQVRVVDPVPAGVTNVHNVVLIDDDLCKESCDTDDEDTPVDAAPELHVTKSDDDVTVAPGEELTYSIRYRNGGDEDATGVSLVEIVPEHTTFVDDGPGGWTCVEVLGVTVCTYPIGVLPASDDYGSVTFTVLVDDPLPAGIDTLHNDVVIDDDLCRKSCDDADEDTPVDAAPDLTVQKDDGGVSAAPGDEVTYTLVYANIGDQDATGVVLTETVPTGSTFVGPDDWTCVDGTCTLVIGDLPAGEGGTVDFTVRVDDPFPVDQTELDNVVVIDDDGENGPDPTPEDNVADDQTPVTQPEVIPNDVTRPPTDVEAAVALPRTGTDVGRTVAIAAVLLLAGAAAMALDTAVTRRRRRTS